MRWYRRAWKWICLRWLGPLVNTFDTTDGCIGIATDAEMKAVAEWVRARRAKEILIQ